jgi:signal transduction histidine kinase
MAIDSLVSARISKNAPSRYGAALLATVLALLARWALNPFLGDRGLYLTLFPAVVFSALYCGIGPSMASILVVVLALAGATHWFIPPTHSVRIISTAQFVVVIAFLLASGVIVAMAEVHRRNNEALRRAQGELDERVKQRTAELDTANHGLRELSARLLQLQDDERRRFARELHDSVGQMLAALTMNLSADIERLSKTASSLTNSEALVQEMSKEVRTISHLLHPPLLDEAGLSSALRWYIDGFAERSKIKVDLEFPDDFGRLPRELEITIFRTVQECLTNIHRHSGSPIAKIRITRSGSRVRAEVEDRGKGIPPEKRIAMESAGTPGVGIRGMRERIRQLGGSLEINSDGKGTVIVARLPIADTSVLAATATEGLAS